MISRTILLFLFGTVATAACSSTSPSSSDGADGGSATCLTSGSACSTESSWPCFSSTALPSCTQTPGAQTELCSCLNLSVACLVCTGVDGGPSEAGAGDADADADAGADGCPPGEGPFEGTPCSTVGLQCQPSALAVGCMETCTCDGTKFTCPGCDGGHD
jgi:hypothetical protein